MNYVQIAYIEPGYTHWRYAHPTEQTMRDATAEMDALLPEDQNEAEEKEDE